MNKRLLGQILIVWGGIGVYGRFSVYQASNAANPSLTSWLINLDPARFVSIFSEPSGYGANLLDPGMLFDLTVIGVGWWLTTR